MTVDIFSLFKRYDQHFALHVPELRIASGEAVGLVGNNGAGKTTFLRLLLDLIRADTGNVIVGGQPISEETDWKAQVGAYLDESFLIDFLRPDEFLQFIGRVYGMNRTSIDKAIGRYEGFLPGEALKGEQPYIRELSMGNKKKIGLVAALFTQPRLLILDEPFANLDPRSQIQLKNILRQLRLEQGTTMLISSHDLVHVTDICERITLLDAGQIVRDMKTSDATLHELEQFFTDDEEGHPARRTNGTRGTGTDNDSRQPRRGMAG